MKDAEHRSFFHLTPMDRVALFVYVVFMVFTGFVAYLAAVMFP